MRSGASGVRIVPRLLFEGWSGQDYRELFADDDMMLKISQELIRTLKVTNCYSGVRYLSMEW